MIFISFLISFLLGYFLLRYFIPKNIKVNKMFIFCLSFPIGIGISSVIFIVLNLFGCPSFFILFIEIVLISFLVYTLKAELFKKYKLFFQFNFETIFKNLFVTVLIIVLGYSLIINASIFILESIREPHGLWDAWAYWNLKSKFITRAPNNWELYFNQMNSIDFHIDYPLLQSGYMARTWIYSNNESVLVPIIYSFIITFSTVGILVSSLSFIKNLSFGLMAGLILLSTPFYMVMAYSQYADNSVAVYFLISFIFLHFANLYPEDNKKYLFIVGFVASLAAWTKNEGILFILCLLVSFIIIAIFIHKSKLNELIYLTLGMFPVLVLLIYYKVVIAPTNDLILTQNADSLVEKILNWDRYNFIFNWFYKQIISFGKWEINPWWIFLIGAIVTGTELKKNIKIISIGFLLILLMLIGYVFIYVTSYIDLEFHLSTSLHRLFFQLFPLFIFLYFLLLKIKNNSIISVDK